MGKIVVMEFANIEAELKEDLPYDIALKECLSAKSTSLTKGDINATAHASKGAAECYRRLGLLDNATEEYKLALTYFNEIGNNSGVAWTKWAHANLLRQQGNYLDSTRELKEAYTLSQLIKDPRCVAYTVAGLAETSRILGRYTLSYSQHIQALNIFKNMSDYRGVVWAYEGIAQMYKNSGRLKQALNLFELSRKIATLMI
jgi:tetratricopeptide (TPR) repeat protein